LDFVVALLAAWAGGRTPLLLNPRWPDAWKDQVVAHCLGSGSEDDASSAAGAATGGGDPASYLTIAMARARLPIYPEVSNVDGRIGVTAPATGTARLPGGVTFMHRGIFPVTTVQTDFALEANRTYHLRWDPNNGFRMRNLADALYNPSSLSEGNTAFDSTYDDMLIARVSTNSSNAVTVTNLANKNDLWFAHHTGRLTDLFIDPINGYGTAGARRNNNTFIYNWARRPRIDSINVVVGASNPSPAMSGIHGAANAVFNKTIDRYFTRFDVNTDFIGSDTTGIYAEIDFRVMG